MNPSQLRPLAVVTGASTGIGYELAKLFARDGYDLVIAANEPQIHEAVQGIQAETGDTEVIPVEVDLATREGVAKLYETIKGLNRPVDALAANAGRGLGKSFFDQDFERVLEVVNLNITGTIDLIQKVGRDMRDRGQGRILITSSIAALMPGSFQAVYNGTKAFLHSFSFAIRNELKDTGVSVTTLMPGPTETEFFERADLMDTSVGQDDHKDDAAAVAKTGYRAMLKGEGDVVHGLKNKLEAAVAAVSPQTALAEMHRGMAEPGSGKQ
jgi:short-subunit dehydrogenase